MDIDIFIALQDYLYVIDFISHVTLNIKIWKFSKANKVGWRKNDLLQQNRKRHFREWRHNLNVLNHNI
jgi:hypothetical protein